MKRYQKQIILKEIGQTGQEKLANAKVLVIGVGGLGTAVLPYLAAAGIGKIGLIDGDQVEESNLHRQVIYTEKSIHQNKVFEAEKFAQGLNSQVQIETYPYYLNPLNALEIINNYDIVVDATDNIPARHLINDACILLNKAFVYGAVYKFEGQVSVFNFKNGPTYRCLFKDTNENLSGCQETGTLGTSVGLIGMMQANEVLKTILGTGEVLSGKLLTYNLLTNTQNLIRFKKNNFILVDLDFYQQTYLTKSQGISAKKALEENRIFIDIRDEESINVISYKNLIRIPYSLLENKINQLDKSQRYALFCQKGIQSKIAVQKLKKYHLNIKNIIEGADRVLKTLEYEKEKSIY